MRGKIIVIAAALLAFWGSSGQPLAPSSSPDFGAAARVEAVRRRPAERVVVHNLKIGQTQSYSVGAPGVLVHNDSGSRGVLSDAFEAMKKTARRYKNGEFVEAAKELSQKAGRPVTPRKLYESMQNNILKHRRIVKEAGGVDKNGTLAKQIEYMKEGPTHGGENVPWKVP